MKRIYLLAVLGLVFNNLCSQNFSWANRAGLYAYDYGYGIVNDNAGNVYVAGKYEQHAFFSPDSLPNQGNHDIYLAKYNSSGILSWVRTGGGRSGDYAHAVACDGANNVYVAGEIEKDTATNWIIFPGSTITLTTLGSNDVFLTKYDLNGNLLWARSAGGYKNDKAQGVTFDNAGNIYICGFFTDTASFGSTTVYGQGNTDIFVAKYDMNGNFQWVKNAGSADRDEAKSIKCDAVGNVYVCGFYSNGTVFGTQTLTCTSGYYETFLAKYSPSGSLTWVKTGGGAYDDVSWSVTVDNAGLIYVSGEFNASAIFGTAPQLITNGNADVFVACYDALGNVQWVKGAGGPLIDRARGIGSDGTNIFITGQFGNTASFGSNTLNAADSSDIFFAALDNSGNFIRALSVGGPADSYEPLGYESGIAICGETSGNVYATGSTLNGGVFGTTTLTPYSRTDVFVTQISQLTSVNTLVSEAEFILLYPNPTNGNVTLGFTKEINQKVDVRVFNCYGQLLDTRSETASSKINIDLSRQESGVYFIEVKIENQNTLRKKIVVQN
ncbi:MAG TPA: T9SS type A sorting domain-containing protein [Bacteroidia bacterium]|jgi:hypothetical protein|nr:T9SS type A sorting domain-containing protein [Bacteroidia bacterium]